MPHKDSWDIFMHSFLAVEVSWSVFFPTEFGVVKADFYQGLTFFIHSNEESGSTSLERF